MRSSLYLLGLVVGSFACERATPRDSRPTPTKDPLEVTADKVAVKKVVDGDTTGVTIGVARKGKVVFVKGYGYANRESDLLATADTVYRIGGITEQFTAAAVMRLVEQHKLDLDDDIAKYVAVETRGRTVTVRQLLRHASGLPEYRFDGEGKRWAPGRVTATQILERINHLPPNDDSFHSGADYVVLGLAIEKASGEPYARFLKREVIERAHLKHTGPCDAIQGDIAQAYRLTSGPPRVEPAIDSSVDFAAGSLCSTVPDLLAWSAALSSGQVVTAESYRLMTTTEDSVHGLGLIANEQYGRRHIGGGGAGGSHSVTLSEYPNDGITISVMTNAVTMADARIERAVAMAAFGIPSKEVPLPPEVRDSLVGEYEFEGGGRTVVNRWRDKLSIRASGGFRLELEYQGNDTFAALDSPFTVVFHRDQGVVTGLTTYQPPEMGGNIDAVRVGSGADAGSASNQAQQW